MNPEAEKYIFKILNQNVPYSVKVLQHEFIIRDTDVYPPGQLSALFAEYLIEHHLVQNKVVADIGCGSCALGIIAAKNGAQMVIGSDISAHAIQCAKENAIRHGVQGRVHLFQGEGVDFLFHNFSGKIDILLSGAPWDSCVRHDFEAIPDERKTISRSFYDVEDQLMTAILSRGPDLLAPGGQIFITSSMKALDRLRRLCDQYHVRDSIVHEADLHHDDNLHYIVKLCFEQISSDQ